jgi:hypothetical protein
MKCDDKLVDGGAVLDRITSEVVSSTRLFEVWPELESLGAGLPDWPA